MRKFIIPAIIVAFGVIWLLDALHLTPPLGVVWTFGLVAIGVAIFTSRGFNKETFVWGTFFFACAAGSILRQMDFIEWRVEVPLLIIALGVLMGINQTALVPDAPAVQPPPLPAKS